MSKKLVIFTLVTSLCGLSAAARAQGDDRYGQGVRIDLDETGERYVRFLTWLQVWTRLIENNPGTQVQNTPEDVSFDVGLRRARFLIYGQITPNSLILSHIGINNQTFSDFKPQPFFHDFWVEHRVFKNYLTLGTGLHYWNGLSRLSNASTLNILAMDLPIFNWPTIERTDQFARFLGVFAKGQVGGLDYRFALNRPFAVKPKSMTGHDFSVARADYNPDANTIALVGYLQWQFWDQESNLLPFTVGTYLGTKRVFNLGAGFFYHPDAMASLSLTGNVIEHDMRLWAVDGFLDLPLGDRAAVTAYASYFNYDLGPNYMRSVGLMNLGSGMTDTANGPGNAYPMIGSGHHVYSAAGYLLPLRWNETMFQPYTAVQLSKFDVFTGMSNIYEAGFNWFLLGHAAKLTFHYRSRPIMSSIVQGPQGPTKGSFIGRANEGIIQSMIYF